MQCETCVLSFIWDKMKTMAQETVFQMALRNVSRETVQGGHMSGLGSRLTGRAIECLCYKMFACAHVQHKRSYDSCPELKPSDQVLEYKLISIFYP